MQRLSVFDSSIALILSLCRVMADSAPGFWSDKFPMPPGANGPVSVMTNINGVLYVGGSFTEIAGVRARFLAKYDGATWSEVGGGVSGTNSPTVFALAYDGTNLYVGGRFDHAGEVSANCVAIWSGHDWQPLGAGVVSTSLFANRPATVDALVLIGTNLFVGGSFTLAGTNVTPNIARWDGDWHGVGSGVFLPFETEEGISPGGIVSSLATDGTNIFVAGQFLRAGDIDAANVAQWDGATWHAIGNTSDGKREYLVNGERVSGIVDSLLWRDNSLLVAGDFGKVGGVPITNLARWDGATWQSWYSVNGNVRRLTDLSGDVAAVGSFSQIDGITATNVAILHDGQWRAQDLPAPGRETPSTIAKFNNELWVGGDFNSVGLEAGNIAQRVNGVWQPIIPGHGYGLGGLVSDIASDGTNVWVAGSLSSAGGKPARTLAKWDGITWQNADFPTDQATITSIEWVGTNLYVGGAFEIPEVGATNLMRWDGQSWSSVGDADIQLQSLRAMASDATNLFVYAYPVTSGSLLRWWDGSAWHPVAVPDAFDLQPALTALNGNMYIACAIPPLEPFGGPTQVQVSRVNLETSTAEPLGAPLPIQRVRAFGGAGTNLWVFGWTPNFEPKLFRQTEDGWSELIGALTGRDAIFTIKAVGSHLIFGGAFSKIGGVAASGLAEWTESGFRSLGGGVSYLDYPGTVEAIESVGDQLFVGGGFTKAGAFSAGNFSIWTFRSDVRLKLGLAAAPRVVIKGAAGEQVEIEATDDLGIWSKIADLSLTGQTTDFVDRRSMSSGSHFYRVKRPQQ